LMLWLGLNAKFFIFKFINYSLNTIWNLVFIIIILFSFISVKILFLLNVYSLLLSSMLLKIELLSILRSFNWLRKLLELLIRLNQIFSRLLKRLLIKLLNKLLRNILVLCVLLVLLVNLVLLLLNLLLFITSRLMLDLWLLIYKRLLL
jgi:hypothetical protein